MWGQMNRQCCFHYYDTNDVLTTVSIDHQETKKAETKCGVKTRR